MKLRVARSAVADLDEIWAYIAKLAQETLKGHEVIRETMTLPVA